ncbi:MULTISPECIES: hypothetical protein [unclassified Burkholderia]|uniref:hypothetical protein n=1 Tax=unclassified Burkholderia TaxID=2613784 RepID=UPI001964C4E2|nr:MULTISPECIES: hypothetical protein [unclassified Burkholderia]
MDFSHSHNAPVKEWIGKQLAAGLLKARKTNWNDVTLPGEAEARALMLEERERSARIRHEGYARRAAAVTGKQSMNGRAQ